MLFIKDQERGLSKLVLDLDLDWGLGCIVYDFAELSKCTSFLHFILCKNNLLSDIKKEISVSIYHYQQH